MKIKTYYVTASDPISRHQYDPFYQNKFDDLEDAEDVAEDLPEKWADDLCPEDRGGGIYWRVAQVLIDEVTQNADDAGLSAPLGKTFDTVHWNTTCIIEFDTDLWEDADKCCLEPEETEEERKEYAESIAAEISEAEGKYDRVIVKDADLWDKIKRYYLEN